MASLTSISYIVPYGAPRRTTSINCYKDSPRYAKPARLLVASEPKPSSEVCPLESTGFPSTIQINIQTSNSFGSELSNANAGVIICLIDKNGDSILQRIPSILEFNETLLFQRGSADKLTFDSSRLNGIESLWLGVDSGQWRVKGARVTIIEKEDGKVQRYEFITDDDVLIGEESEVSLLELKPARVVELTELDSVDTDLERDPGSSNEQTMRDYEELKRSLLVYDVVLFGMGTIFANALVNESAALALFLGGICGFSYLLLIQKTVDDLSAPPSTILKNNVRFGINVAGVALVAGLTFVLVKRSSSDVLSSLTFRDLVAGMIGFLACKFAVVIAACKRD